MDDVRVSDTYPRPERPIDNTLTGVRGEAQALKGFRQLVVALTVADAACIVAALQMSRALLLPSDSTLELSVMVVAPAAWVATAWAAWPDYRRRS